ncbi:hypothetical protein SO694_00047112 [Aureococcus anophagefferens]|uniref:Nucleotide-diphospho-sugar transferase domain-containing protein n=1 Tax=Aureococcus anophagefferens TaxID=44056 RepID=A0ABR1G873_AURAN
MHRPLAWLALCVASSKALEDVGERGFLLVATSTTLERLWTYEARAEKGDLHQIDHFDDLGAVLRDICRTSFRARLIVGTPKEAAKAERVLPCEQISVAPLEVDEHRRLEVAPLDIEHRRLTDLEHRRLGKIDIRLRFFKVDAILKGLDYAFPGGTLYIDNDGAIRRDGVDGLFAMFDAMRKEKKAVGLQIAYTCLPKDHETKVPESFCERNGGVMFLGDAGKAREILERWSEELRAHPSKDGHDQVSLRTVLFDFRDDLYDLHPVVQHLGVRADVCKRVDTRKGPTLPHLWHEHHHGRLKFSQSPFARRNSLVDAQGLVCGFVP